MKRNTGKYMKTGLIIREVSVVNDKVERTHENTPA